MPEFPPRSAAALPLIASRQLLVVKATDWTSSTAGLQRFARAGTTEAWQPVGSAIKVSLGRSGLGWGRGRHDCSDAGEPVKQEGDGRAPAGIFAITELFGIDAPDSPLAHAAKLPYRCATAQLKCVDDPASIYYNRFVDLGESPARDWHSHEDMLRTDGRYAIGAVVAHNSPDPAPGAGSCIFLHIWQDEGVPTAGCTAASLADMTTICRWLDGAAAPLLVQLPESEYTHFRKAWALP